MSNIVHDVEYSRDFTPVPRILTVALFIEMHPMGLSRKYYPRDAALLVGVIQRKCGG